MVESVGGRITQFIKHVGDYFSYSNAVRYDLDLLALQNKQRMVVPSTTARIADCDHKHYVAGAEALKLGRALAVELEAAGFNTTDLLRFLHMMDCGGGAGRAGKLWADLKASLDRFKIRSAIGKGTRDGEAATPGTAVVMSGEARALGVLAAHPDWTNKRIAQTAGIHVSTLYRSVRFKQARDAMGKPSRPDRRRGRTGKRRCDTLCDT